MPETTLLIKAALNLRVGAVFDVYNRTSKGIWMFIKIYTVDRFGQQKRKFAVD